MVSAPVEEHGAVGAHAIPKEIKRRLVLLCS